MELPVIWRLLKFVVTLNKNAAVVKYFKKPSSIYCASQKSDFLIVEEWPLGPTKGGPGGLYQRKKNPHLRSAVDTTESCPWILSLLCKTRNKNNIYFIHPFIIENVELRLIENG